MLGDYERVPIGPFSPFHSVRFALSSFLLERVSVFLSFENIAQPKSLQRLAFPLLVGAIE